LPGFVRIFRTGDTCGLFDTEAAVVNELSVPAERGFGFQRFAGRHAHRGDKWEGVLAGGIGGWGATSVEYEIHFIDAAHSDGGAASSLLVDEPVLGVTDNGGGTAKDGTIIASSILIGEESIGAVLGGDRGRS
jgi:hypothetical protein